MLQLGCIRLTTWTTALNSAPRRVDWDSYEIPGTSQNLDVLGSDFAATCCNHLGFATGEDVIRSRRWGHWSHQSWNIAAWCRKTSFDLKMMLSMAGVQSHEAQNCCVQSAKLDLQVHLFISVLSGWPLSKFCKRPSRLNPLQLAGVKPPCIPSHRDRQGLLVGCVLPHETEDMAQTTPTTWQQYHQIWDQLSEWKKL